MQLDAPAKFAVSTSSTPGISFDLGLITRPTLVQILIGGSPV
eukprot:CAMPEP_0205915856 /NCGR_PEP_ID=MMETSP1325-20131115/8142_1 /ASSEMBLY_ACC=CAM_ASM_000708 /TAXON_ID=236786 /ORGANISM="Florenciella sp., Strain RCC1007" /LENGTH=41 /DNA_ID= /DNA_START= /DNA_END= /DNA_ORIENTATION=